LFLLDFCKPVFVSALRIRMLHLHIDQEVAGLLIRIGSKKHYIYKHYVCQV